MVATLLGSLRFRVACASALVVAVVLGVSGVLIVQRTIRDDRAELDQRLERQAEAFARAATLGRALGVAGGPERVPRWATSLLSGSDTAVRIYVRGVPVFAAGPLPGTGLPQAPLPGVRTLHSATGPDWRSSTRAATGAVTAEALTSMQSLDARWSRLRRTVAALAGAGLVIAGLSAALLAGLVLRPLQRLRRTADAVADPAQSEPRIPPQGAQEVRSVARALNSMLDRLQAAAGERDEAMEATRRFVADAGHELRTPLATLGATLEHLDRHPDLDPVERAEAIRDGLVEHARLTAMTSALQTLARGDGGRLGDEREVDLQELVGAAIDAAARRYPQATFTLGDGPPVAPVHGSPFGLRILVDNLLENAARHGGVAHAADVTVTLTDGGTSRTLMVEDDGPGIPENEREAVFERFHRAPGSADGGSGLGLAIVAQQARRHGGTVRADAAIGGGARIVVVLDAGEPLP